MSRCSLDSLSPHAGGRLPRCRSLLLLAAACAAMILLAAPLPVPAAGTTDVSVLVDSLAGGWAADAVETPLGPLPFALLFERRPDGSLAAHTPWDEATFVDLAFRRGSDGRWLLLEHARLPEAGDQRRILVPAGRTGTTWRFADAADPGLLAVDLDLAEDAMEITVWVRGERHVHGVLRRVPAEALAGLRERLRALGARPHRPLGETAR